MDAVAGVVTTDEEHTGFPIREYRVRGNTLLELVDIERILYPHLGDAKNVNDVEAARLSLEHRYRDAGYPTVLVDIPEQDVGSGVVHLNVTESKIERLKVTGSDYFSLDRIRAEVPALAEGEVLSSHEVQAQLAALNSRTADRVVTPVLRPGVTPGTVEAELRVDDRRPLHGSVELNNKSSADTSDLRLSASLSYDNLWQKLHSFSLQYQTAPEEPKEVQVVSGTYIARFSGTNNLLAIYGVHSESDTATVGNLSVIGDGDIIGLRGIFPLAPHGNVFHTFTLGLDYKDFNENVELQGADALSTPIDYFLFSAQYNATTRSERGVLTRFNVSANFSARGLEEDKVACDTEFGAVELNEFSCKRFEARPNFLYLRGGLNRTQAFFASTEIYFSLQGQLTDSPLISNEQFSVGGADTVRGYHESQELGDDGLVSKLELRSPSIGSKISSKLDQLIFLGFVDAASVRVREALPGQDASTELSSAGVGLRLTAFKQLDATLDWAQVYKTSGSVESGDTRGHFSLRYEF